jgi:uncharacterized repeat protein (TIGR03803 family)
LGIAILALVSLSAALSAQTERVLYSFTSEPDGTGPIAGLVMDKTGALYGTTVQGGDMVFKLAPPAKKGGSWTETTIYSFSTDLPDGDFPYDAGSLVLDKTGTGILYGTARDGGINGYGTVFELTPPASGDTWAETVLYAFNGGGDAQYPYAGLTMAGGALYGTTQWGGAFNEGAVFKLTPPTSPGGAWSETVLYSFTGGSDGGEPMSSPTVHGGMLYGTTRFGGVSNINGVVYLLSPPAKGSTAWTETVLHAFPTSGNDGANPYGALIFDKQGALYGTTSGTFGAVPYGLVFKLTPPDWEETILYSFTNGSDGAAPEGSLIFDNTGALYGTTAGTGAGTSHGSVFKLSPPAVVGDPWTETTLHTFTGGSDGGTPLDGLLLSGGVLYGTTYEGGPEPTCNCGVVFEVKP